MIQNDNLDTLLETMYISDPFGNSLVSSTTLSPYIFSTLDNNVPNGLQLSEGADIKIGNVSLMDTLNIINSRLAILQVNPELEERWSELKELGDRYRELEKEIQGKEKVWNILKK